MVRWNEKQYHCPVEVSMDLLSGKYMGKDCIGGEVVGAISD
jgi:hypothetical protein